MLLSVTPQVTLCPARGAALECAWTDALSLRLICVEIRLLGTLRVTSTDGSDVVLRAPKLRTLLAYLLLHRRQTVSVDRIADALWQDRPPASAANLVHGYVRDLRRALGPTLIRTVPGGYWLDDDGCTVDFDRFTELARTCRYRDALALWQGDALAEWADQPWAQVVATRLEEERLVALERGIAVDLDHGMAAEVVGELSSLVAQAPLRERPRALLITALYQSGRQAEALQAYLAARRTLVEEIGIEPGPELRALESAVLAQDPSLTPASGRVNGVPLLPTAIIGRDSELEHLQTLLARARLVTVTGPGGVGKTSLAVEAAREASEAYADVWVAELASARTKEQVVATIAGTLRLARPAGATPEAIVDYLRARRGLLVLDNCEHIVDPVAALASVLLRACRQLAVLATSRETLQIAGEHVVQLGGLATEASVALFAARARSANPAVVLDEDAVRRVVEKLDGLPLAIELAAARAVSLTVEQIEAGLSAPLELLTTNSRDADPRHATMRAVIGWSHDLLPEPGRAALAQLSVFAGSFTLDAAQSVLGEDALVRVERLLARCLLTRCPDVARQARYRMLELMRQYAQEQADATTLDEARRRHLAYHAGLSDSLAQSLLTRDAPSVAAVARACVDDLREAVRLALDTADPDAGRMVANLYWPWFLDGRLAELRLWVERAQSITDDPAVRARLDRALASASIAQGDLTQAVVAATRQLQLAQLVGDEEQIALAHNLLGMVAWAHGDPDAIKHHTRALVHAELARQPWPLILITALAGRAAHAAGDHTRGDDLLEEAVRLAERQGEPTVLGTALDYRAHAAFANGEPDRAWELAERALAAYRNIGYQEGIASAATLGACLAVLNGRREAADPLLAEAHEVCRRLGHRGGIATVFEASALVRHNDGDNAAAVHALGQASARRHASATTTPPELAGHIDRMINELRAALGPDEFARNWHQGEGLATEVDGQTSFENGILSASRS